MQTGDNAKTQRGPAATKLRAAGFNAEDAEVLAKVAMKIPSAFLCANLCGLCVKNLRGIDRSARIALQKFADTRGGGVFAFLCVPLRLCVKDPKSVCAFLPEISHWLTVGKISPPANTNR